MNNLQLDFKVKQFPKKDEEVLDKLLSRCNKTFPIIYEIGCWAGKSTSHLAEFAKEHSGIVFAIDTFKGEGSLLSNYAKEIDILKIFKQNMKILGLIKYINIKQGHSDEFVMVVPKKSIDFMFIDGNHCYSSIKSDIDNWWPKIRKRGILCGHDYNGRNWDERFIERDYVNGMHHGVSKAVCEKFKNFENEGNIWWKIKL